MPGSRYTVNHDFFSVWSPEMAYVLGYIYGDGCIDVRRDGRWPRLRIYAAPSDRELLEDIKRVMGSNHPILVQPPACLVIAFYSEKMFRTVGFLGKRPARVSNCVWPESIPDIFIRDFIRGYMDAEGCHRRFNKTQYKTTSRGLAKYVSEVEYLGLRTTDKVIIERIAQFLSTILCRGVRVCVTRPRGKSKLLQYGVYFSGKSARRVLGYLHYPGCMCLRRKVL